MNISRPISILLVLACACDRAAAKHSNVDQPDPIPQPRLAPPPKVEPPKVDPAGNTIAPECTRGTGRNEAGECVTLSTRQLAHVQQVQIPGGDFVVGDAPSDYDFSKARAAPKLRWAGQPPRFAKSDGFWIDFHEVTRAAYEACVARGKCTKPVCDPAERIAKIPPESLPNLPQTCVSHEQAEKYCATQGGRLPTEIEWEYAARGVDARLFPWGSEIRDEYMAGLMSVNLEIADTGYFGLRSQGSSATEWVADVFDRDAPLATYLEGPFRDPEGPLAKALGKQPLQHVFKSARLGDRYPEDDADAMLGFRCAADLGGEVPRLLVPVAPKPLPMVRPLETLRLFGGIAEAVSLAEAKTFCERLTVNAEGRKWTDWRLPTLAEVNGIAEAFRGPGPFWSASDGPIAQVAGAAPTDRWVTLESADGKNGDALAARCVHD